ncbi:hypothetical protein WA538_004354, partial [Blastocystis sp. DL]
YYTCTLFNRNGKRIFYREYNRTYNAFQGNPEEETKLICGFLLSMNAIIEKISPDKENENGLRSFRTKTYTFHYLETATGLRIVVTTDVDVVDIQTQLWKIYSAFANIVVQNPNWSVEDEIDMP